MTGFIAWQSELVISDHIYVSWYSSNSLVVPVSMALPWSSLSLMHLTRLLAMHAHTRVCTPKLAEIYTVAEDKAIFLRR